MSTLVLKNPKLQHRYKTLPYEGFDPGGEVMVERAGYRTASQQVAEFVAAGAGLLAERARRYFEYPMGEVPEDVIPDPTRSGNFDLADASRMGREVRARIRERERVLKLEEDARKKREQLELLSTQPVGKRSGPEVKEKAE